jgi:hypothetical protein
MWLLELIVAFGLVGLVAMFFLTMRRPIYGIYGGFLLSGILIAPKLPLVGSKLAAPDAPLVMALLGILLGLILNKQHAIPLTSPFRAAFAAVAIFIATAILSLALNIWRFPIDVIENTVDILNYVYGALIFFAAVLLIDDWHKWRLSLIAWMVGAAVVVTVSVAAAIGMGPEWAYHEDSNRIKSTLRAVNQLQSYLGPVAPIVFWIAITPSYRIYWRALAAAMTGGVALAMLVTGSRSSMLLLFVGLLGVALLALFKGGRRPLTAFAVVGTIAAGFAASTYVTTLVQERGLDALPEHARAIARPILLFQAAADVDDVLGGRGEQIRIVSENWWQYPTLGVGTGNFAKAFKHDHEVHNSYLGVLMEQGLLGLASIILFMTAVAWSGWRATQHTSTTAMTRDLLVIVLLGFLIVCAYGAFSFGMRQRAFWLISALVMSASLIPHRSSKS